MYHRNLERQALGEALKDDIITTIRRRFPIQDARCFATYFNSMERAADYVFRSDMDSAVAALQVQRPARVYLV